MNIKETVQKLIEAKVAYYNSEPIMTDAEFDDLEDLLRQIDPDNDYFSMVGISIKGKKIKHEIPMLSCQKVKNIEELKKWFEKSFNQRYEFCVTPKYDGLSFTAKYEKGKLKYLATRGNGKIGQDITDKAQYIQDIALEINDLRELEIRGELIIEKNHNNYFNNKPLRNICVGLINRKEDFNDLKYVKAVAYNVLHVPFKSEIEKYNFLNLNNWHNTSPYFLIYSLEDIEKLYEEWTKINREKFSYEVDGLVLTINECNIQQQYIGRAEHHYDYQIALKFNSETKKTKLLGINWNVSKSGAVIPTAFFEPIYIQGRKIENASLSNYENVIRMKLELNDELLVSLSNDVIPYIEENLSKNIKQR